jgi:hypothetical protein
MASHEPFGHLKPKLWAKEGPEVKLAIWLPTTKSQESTCSQHALQECDMALESSLQGLQVWFRPRPDRRLMRGAMKSQSPRSPNRDNFGTPLWESREKEPFGCHSQWANVENTIGSMVVASPESGPWCVLWVRVSPWLVLTPNGCRMTSNQLVLVLNAGSWPNSLISS